MQDNGDELGQVLESPNLNDFKMGFEEEKKDEIQLDDQNHMLYRPGFQLKGMTQGGDFLDPNVRRPQNIVEANSMKKMGFLKKDTNKIKTNPKYRCVDELSDDGNDEQKNEEYNQLSSKELDFRETILKFEKKRKKKERRQKEKEQKKMRAMTGEDTSAGDAQVDSKDSGADDDEIEGEESSSSEEGKQGTNHNSGHNKAGRDHNSNDEGEVSSVTTRQNKTERNHYILRMAIDEKYIPGSIKNLRYAAYIIFFILMILAVVYYVIQISLYNNINQNIKNIDNSEQRLNYIIDITLRTRTLVLINEEYKVVAPENMSSVLNNTISELRSAASNLKNAQTDLSYSTATLSEQELEKINPNNVELNYKKI